MSNVVKFLEALGQRPELVSDLELASCVRSHALNEEVKDSILARDVNALRAQVSAKAVVYSFLAPAEDEEKKDEDSDENSDESGREESVRAA